jgi:hypothetical protein
MTEEYKVKNPFLYLKYLLGLCFKFKFIIYQYVKLIFLIFDDTCCCNWTFMINVLVSLTVC